MIEFTALGCYAMAEGYTGRIVPTTRYFDHLRPEMALV